MTERSSRDNATPVYRWCDVCGKKPATGKAFNGVWTCDEHKIKPPVDEPIHPNRIPPSSTPTSEAGSGLTEMQSVALGEAAQAIRSRRNQNLETPQLRELTNAVADWLEKTTMFPAFTAQDIPPNEMPEPSLPEALDLFAQYIREGDKLDADDALVLERAAKALRLHTQSEAEGHSEWCNGRCGKDGYSSNLMDLDPNAAAMLEWVLKNYGKFIGQCLDADIKRITTREAIIEAMKGDK